MVNWKKIPTPPGETLKQISYYGSAPPTLSGLTTNGEIYIATTNLESNPDWRKIEGGLKQIVVFGDDMFGVADNNKLFHRKRDATGGWTTISGELVQISFDGNQLYGIAANDYIMAADSNLTSNPNWRRVEGALKFVNVGDRLVFGLAADQSVFIGASRGPPNWENTGNKFKQISFSGTSLVAVNDQNQVFVSYATYERAKIPWTAIEGGLVYVNISHDKIYGLSTDATLWFASDAIVS